MTLLYKISLVPRPHPLMRKRGLVTIEYFLGFAESAVSILNKPMRWCCIIKI